MNKTKDENRREKGIARLSLTVHSFLKNKIMMRKKEMNKTKDENRREKGIARLSLTVHNCEEFGEVPTILMEENPGKTNGELLPDEDLLSHLQCSKKQIKALLTWSDDYENLAKTAETERKDLELDIAYLKKINRLPKEFEDFDIDSLEQKQE